MRHHARNGMRLPLNLGAPGRVILVLASVMGQDAALWGGVARRGLAGQKLWRMPSRLVLTSLAVLPAPLESWAA